VAVAKIVGVHDQTVRRSLKSDPKHAVVIAGLREINRTPTMAAIQRINPKLPTAWRRRWASAKDLDALSRARLNVETVAAGASGEPASPPSGPVQVEVVFPRWAPPIQAQVIESQAEALALTAGDPARKLRTSYRARSPSTARR
jgi:hypothetical protein